MEKLHNFINGELVAPSNGNYLPVYNPATGEIYAELPASDEKDVLLAIEAASNAFPIWSKWTAEQRGACLRKLSQAIEERMEEFVHAESRDNGKPISLAAHVDIPRAVSNLDFYASAIVHFASESHYMEGVGINYTTRKPLGVVACISPWNLPLYLFTWKIAPALAAGNCVIAKPSEITPYTAYLMSKLINEAGFPKGVFNLVHGFGSAVGDPLCVHPKVKAVSFTGGTTTGAHIAQRIAPLFKKSSLELGGKNAAILFADCNFEEAIKTTLRSSFANQGQICLCGSRILVERSIYERFKTEFVERAKNWIVLPPNDPKAKMGALVSEQHLNKVLSYIALAKEEGGVVLCGGERLNMKEPYHNGYYMSPAVIEGLDMNCRTNQEEIFGPVVTLMPFDTEEEALELANGVKYGLSATVWTTNLQRAHRVADELEVGLVWVNDWLVRDLRTPFGGTKASGVGREGGWEALRFFTEPKNTFIRF